VLAAQAPFDLGHEVIRQRQVIEGLLEGFGGMLRLATVTREALVRFEAALSGFRAFFGVLLRGRHAALLRCVCVFGGGSLPKRP
jgi:hypothetical protein